MTTWGTNNYKNNKKIKINYCFRHLKNSLQAFVTNECHKGSEALRSYERCVINSIRLACVIITSVLAHRLTAQTFSYFGLIILITGSHGATIRYNSA